jgi:hypothetical protein
MTTKERWTVYPLLLLAIGLAVRGNMSSQPRVSGLSTGTVIADTVVCKELAIVADDGRIMIHAGRVKGGDGGGIEFFGPAGTPIGRFGPNANPPAKPNP